MSKVVGIMYCEFHPTLGPKIVYQVPEEFISKDFFDSISPYVITKHPLRERVVSIRVNRLCFVGCPQIIEDDRYARNLFMFNVCFIFNDDCEDTVTYERVVKKLCRYLRRAEMDGFFLSSDVSKLALPDILKSVMTDLNACGHCSIYTDDTSRICLKLVDVMTRQTRLTLSTVPALLQHVTSQIGSSDLAIHHVLSALDGTRHLRGVHQQADIDLELVRLTLQDLHSRGLVAFLPVFLYNSSYEITDNIRKLLDSEDFKQSSLDFSANSTVRSVQLHDLWTALSSLGRGLRVKEVHDLCGLAEKDINEHRLVQYGVFTGFLRRKDLVAYVDSELVSPGTRLAEYIPFLDGVHNIEQVCVVAGAGYTAVECELTSSPEVRTLLKGRSLS